MREMWKQVPGWEGYYSASSLGRIKRDAGSPRCKADRLITPALSKYGYFLVSPVRVGYKQRPVAVHRIILETFVGPPPTDKHQGNHLNGIKTDNRVANLEWATRSENIAHAYANGLHGRYIGSAASAAKLSEADVVDILARVAAREYRRDIAARFGVSTKAIDEIVGGHHWTHVQRPDLSTKRKGRDVLTPDDVRDIKRRLAVGDRKKDIAVAYGVSVGAIQHIHSGFTWKDI